MRVNSNVRVCYPRPRLSATGRLPTANHENSLAACVPGAASSMKQPSPSINDPDQTESSRSDFAGDWQPPTRCGQSRVFKRPFNVLVRHRLNRKPKHHYPPRASFFPDPQSVDHPLEPGRLRRRCETRNLGRASALGCHSRMRPMILTRKSSSQAAALRFRRKLVFFWSGGIQPNQIEDDLLQEGKILWGVVFTYGAGILAEADVERC